jgi:ABC-type phosphate transport system auxiliary subunit
VSEVTCSLLVALQRSIDDFLAGRCDIAELQARLAMNASALDRSFSELTEELRGLDADLEEIQFTMLRDEQRSAAVFRLARAHQLLVAAMKRCE